MSECVRRCAAGHSSRSLSRVPSKTNESVSQPWSAAHAQVALQHPASHGDLSPRHSATLPALSASLTTPAPLHVAGATQATSRTTSLDANSTQDGQHSQASLAPTASVPQPARTSTGGSTALAPSPSFVGSGRSSANGAPPPAAQQTGGGLSNRPSQDATGRQQSGGATPQVEFGRQLSIHALIAAMKEVHEEEARKGPIISPKGGLAQAGSSASLAQLNKNHSEEDLFANALRQESLMHESAFAANGYRL